MNVVIVVLGKIRWQVRIEFFGKEVGRELLGLAEGETWQGMNLR